jgi:sugar phosphate isomerase/epimerase
MNQISFMTANYVARPVGYHMTEGWMQGDHATNAYFEPLATFEQRFEGYLADVKAMGFDALDLWLALLNPTRWATDEHIALARGALARQGLSVVSLAGWFGSTLDEFERCCRMAAALDTTVMAGMCGVLESDRAGMIRLLEHYNVKFAIENHPEKTPEEVLTKIGDGAGGRIGAAPDTGWFGTQGYPAPQAIEALFPHILHVHLKDVLAPGAHETCRFGAGCVDIEACVQTLKRLGYTGSMCIEHEPESYDPTEDCIASLALLKGWLA